MNLGASRRRGRSRHGHGTARTVSTNPRPASRGASGWTDPSQDRCRPVAPQRPRRTCDGRGRCGPPGHYPPVHDVPSDAAEHGQGLCGVPLDASQPTAGKGTAGQVLVTVSQGGQTLWRFVAVRPAASSGTNGSGIELRHVDYKGKRVLYRAHVPILNVKYNADACGPYRDWQYQEGMIQSQGIDVAPVFRLSPGPARRRSWTPGPIRATSSVSASTSFPTRSVPSPRWRPAGTATSANGDSGPTAPSDPGSGSPPWSTPASATSTTTTPIGGSTSTFARPPTIGCASSTPRRFLAIRSGTRSRSRPPGTPPRPGTQVAGREH